jgi:hypothetical protein
MDAIPHQEEEEIKESPSISSPLSLFLLRISKKEKFSFCCLDDRGL